MQSISDWLRRLGMSEYIKCFVENRIDFSVLPDLTDQHLKELGIALGDRLKLLRAIQELGSTPPLSPKLSPSEPKVEEVAERRQVTVMFSDLVGSTALAARLDPEDMREVIAAYHTSVAEAVRRFDGFVAQYLGDGVLVYFGYPQAHEDDAERAVRVGLELVATVVTLKTHASLKIRVGIATGLVVVGDLIGTGPGIIGETPNLAARLQGVAEPNMVVIAESTRRLLGNLFELQDLGAKRLKGIEDPVRTWAALRSSAVGSRFDALRATRLTPLVGREEECELLLRRWLKAKAGEGQVVLLSGEAGIGKSRLTAALLERLAGEPYTRLRYFCSPQHLASAFYPFIGQMERAAGLTHDDSVQARLDKIDALLMQNTTSPQDSALIAEMLSLPNDGRYPVLALTPEQRRQRTLDALIAQMEALARRHPVLIIFEDAHWADPTSLELFDRVVGRIRTLHALLVVTLRPELAPPWSSRPHVTTLTLHRLTDGQIEEMVDDVVGHRLLPSRIRRAIIERSDGIPLFVEEMTKAVLEAGSEVPTSNADAAVAPPTHLVPVSLHASLMARLDRLGPAKMVAQIGAAIGREFSHSLLAAVASQTQAELESGLDRLMHAGLLFRRSAPPHAIYLFKHALVQDVAYSTLLRGQRRTLHGRIAEALEMQFGDIADSQSELLARHCTEAGLTAKAARQWAKAAYGSLARSALVEAADQFTRALAQLRALPMTSALRQEEIKLQVELANALMQTKGSAAPETKVAIDQAGALIKRAEELGEPPEDQLLFFSVLFGAWIKSFVAFDGKAVRELAAQFLALAQKKGATVPIMIGHRLMGSSLQLTGDIAPGRVHYDQALALYDSAIHRPFVARFGQDNLVTILCWRSVGLWLLGYPEAALAGSERGLKEAREIDQVAALMFALSITNVTRLLCRHYAMAGSLAKELFALADEKGAPLWRANAIIQQGCALAHTGTAFNSAQMISSGIAEFRSTGATVRPWQLSFLAMVRAELCQFDDAWNTIDEAIAAMETTGEKWYEAEVNRVAGEIALMMPQRDESKAHTYFARAMESARKQQAKSWELRSAMSIARLWRSQSKRDEARDLLAPVYAWFSEGFETPDLRDAKALLADLVP
jgi:class 3 adenylate cyclase/predicted ATPase